MDAIKEITKKWGQIIVEGPEFIEQTHQIIKVSPTIDAITNGGIPEGSVVLIVGLPKVGKTTLALHIASKAQRPEYGKRHVYFADIEGRLKEMNVNSISGLDLTRFHIIRSTEDNILSAQKYLNILTELILATKESVFICDSFSTLAHQKEIEEGVGTSTRGGGAMLVSQFLRNNCNVIPIKSHILIGTNHLMANTSGYGKSQVEKGSMATQYHLDVKLRVKSIEYIEAGKSRVGQKLNWLCESSALGSPGMEMEGYIRYGKGIDEAYEAMAIALNAGLISGNKWYVLDFMKNYVDWNEETEKKYKYHGKEQLYKFISTNSEIQNYLYKEIAKVMGMMYESKVGGENVQLANDETSTQD